MLECIHFMLHIYMMKVKKVSLNIESIWSKEAGVIKWWAILLESLFGVTFFTAISWEIGEPLKHSQPTVRDVSDWTIFGWKNCPGYCIILLFVIVISAGCIVRMLFNLTAKKNKFEVIMMTVSGWNMKWHRITREESFTSYPWHDLYATAQLHWFLFLNETRKF